MLLSKRPEMFHQKIGHLIFLKLRVVVWDLDNKKYYDCSIMGIGTNTLGYGHKEIDKEVRKTISNGNMSTFNCPEEVALAEKLIEINEWSLHG